jgi:hypothetical protein
MARSSILRLTLVVLCLAACGDDDVPSDGATPDAPGTDAPVRDGGPPGPRTVTVTTADDHPLFAAQDGDGAWTALTPSGAGYSFTVTGERWAIAYACETTATVSVNIIAATVSDATDVEVDCATGPTGEPPGPKTLVTVGGSVTGLTSGEEASIQVAGRAATVTGGTYSLMVPEGTRDVFAVRGGADVDRIIRRNDVALTEGATMDFDFGTEGFAPETHTVTVTGAGAADPVNVLTLYLNRAGGSPFATGSRTDRTFRAFPAAEVRGEDYHSVSVGMTDASAGWRRNVRRAFVAAEDFTADIPAIADPPTITAAATSPYLQPETTLPAGSDADFTTTVYTQNETTPAAFTRAWAVSATRAWTADAAATTFAVPDLSGLAGFVARWGLVAGNELSFQQSQSWSSQGTGTLLDANQTTAELDGLEERGSHRTGTTTL